MLKTKLNLGGKKRQANFVTKFVVVVVVLLFHSVNQNDVYYSKKMLRFAYLNKLKVTYYVLFVYYKSVSSV